MIRAKILFSLLLISILGFSQSKYPLVANLQSWAGNVTVFVGWDSLKCSPFEEVRTVDKNIPVLDKVSCSGNEKSWYLVYANNQRMYLHKVWVEDTLRVDSALTELKGRTTFNEREQILIAEAIENKRIQAIKDREEERAELRKIDSTTKEYEKIMAAMRKSAMVAYESNWWYESKYSISPNVRIKVLNPFKKKVKYFYFTIACYNPVGDLVGTKTVTGIGPMEYMEAAQYVFDYVVSSRVVDKVIIKQVKILFFDGTTIIQGKPFESEYRFEESE